MKRILFLLFALFVAASSAAADDDKRVDAPHTVEAMELREIPLNAEVPQELDYQPVLVQEPIRCWKDNRDKHLQLMQYGLIIGIAFDAGPYGSYLGAAYVTGDYAACKIRKRRLKRRLRLQGSEA